VSSPSDSAREPRPLVLPDDARDEFAIDEFARWLVPAAFSEVALDVRTEPMRDDPARLSTDPAFVIAALMLSLRRGSRDARSASSRSFEDPVAFIFKVPECARAYSIAGPAPRRLSAASGSRALTAATTAASRAFNAWRDAPCAACTGRRVDGGRAEIAGERRVSFGIGGERCNGRVESVGAGGRWDRVKVGCGVWGNRVRYAPPCPRASSSPGPCRVHLRARRLCPRGGTRSTLASTIRRSRDFLNVNGTTDRCVRPHVAKLGRDSAGSRRRRRAGGPFRR
jgi:hypothetical protein